MTSLPDSVGARELQWGGSDWAEVLNSYFIRASPDVAQFTTTLPVRVQAGPKEETNDCVILQRSEDHAALQLRSNH